MNRQTIYARVIAFALFFLTAIFYASAQTQLHQHIVKQGETLYRLSTSFGVTVDQILKYNPGLSNHTLRTGNTVLIPLINKTDEIRIAKEHKVKRKETLYSIAQKYDISVEELKMANPEMFAPDYKLKKGKKINIPYPSSKQQVNKQTASHKEKAVAANGYETVKVAIMLPFTADAAGSNRCIEFYRGFLLAVEKMQGEGKNVEIYAFNEPHAKSSIITILEQIRLKRVHLMVGPLYFDHFAAVSKFSNTNKIKTLIPFSSKVNEINSNPYLFLLNAPEQEKHEYAADLFLKNFVNYKAIFVGTESRNQRGFTSYLRSRLISEGIEIDDITNMSSETQIEAVCHSKKQNVFIPDGAEDRDFERTIARIVKFNNHHKHLKTALFAYPEWLKFNYNRRSDMHLANTYLFTNAFYSPWSATTNELKQKYITWFNSDIIETTPRMFLLGYDTALTFINGIATYGRRFNTQDQKLPLQQSDIVFRKLNSNGGYINGSMWFVHYRTDYQIEKVSER